MLIEFSVANFRSIKEMQTLSFEASKLTSQDPQLDVDNLIHTEANANPVLKVVGIYGANASGKSNVITALGSMIQIIQFSFSDKKYNVSRLSLPFTLCTESSQKPSFFEIVFLSENKRYKYGFEIKNNEVMSEWLFGPANKKEVNYFTRENVNHIIVNPRYYQEGVGLEDKTLSSNLFLNVVQAFNGGIAKQIKNTLARYLAFSGLEDVYARKVSLQLFDSLKDDLGILRFIQDADFNIENLHTEKNENNDIRLVSSHNIFDKNGHVVKQEDFLFHTMESAGTDKVVTYSIPILSILKHGSVLMIDEFDARLHPNLTKRIVQLFISPKTNKANGQLLFVTHDTNLLDKSLLRRDQVYFTEKNKRGETELYSLNDIKGVRNDASFSKDYLQGKYGAIPYLGNIDRLFE